MAAAIIGDGAIWLRLTNDVRILFIYRALAAAAAAAAVGNFAPGAPRDVVGDEGEGEWTTDTWRNYKGRRQHNRASSHKRYLLYRSSYMWRRIKLIFFICSICPIGLPTSSEARDFMKTCAVVAAGTMLSGLSLAHRDDGPMTIIHACREIPCSNNTTDFEHPDIVGLVAVLLVCCRRRTPRWLPLMSKVGKYWAILMSL